ncbi:hypothetical protein [Kitasatospora sp. NPDC085879]|uniref:hypothetical protein n=1 Tax=Kitasatospora sp. NPDC085879 TaxID=3154769 RepID=UPI0034251458
MTGHQAAARTVVITGATGGIGRACAAAFAARGDRLALIARGRAGYSTAPSTRPSRPVPRRRSPSRPTSPTQSGEPRPADAPGSHGRFDDRARARSRQQQAAHLLGTLAARGLRTAGRVMPGLRAALPGPASRIPGPQTAMDPGRSAAESPGAPPTPVRQE